MSNDDYLFSLTNSERRELERLEKLDRAHRSVYIAHAILITIIWTLAIIVGIVRGDKIHVWQGLFWLGSFLMISLIAVHKQLKLYRIIKKFHVG